MKNQVSVRLKKFIDSELKDIFENSKWIQSDEKQIILFSNKYFGAFLFYYKGINEIYVFKKLINLFEESTSIEATDIFLRAVLEWFNENNPKGLKFKSISLFGDSASTRLDEGRKDDIIDRILDKLKLGGMTSLESDEENYLKSKGESKIPVSDMTDQEIYDFFIEEFGNTNIDWRVQDNKSLLFFVDKDKKDVISIRRTIVIIDDKDGNVCSRFGSEAGEERLINFFNGILEYLLRNDSKDTWDYVSNIMIDGCDLQNIEIDI